MYYKDDEAYVDPSEANGQTRPSYESARKTVEARQQMTKLKDGTWVFKSDVTPDTWHQLDQYGREAIPRQDGRGYNLQRPALDHKVQYAALNEYYHTQVQQERQKAQQGLQRRHSLDLHNAFHNAVADPSNLRLVSHDEHVSFGGAKRMGQFSDQEKRAAKTLFDTHLTDVSSTSLERINFNLNRPRSSVPLPQGTSTGMTVTTRSMTNARTNNGGSS